MSFLPENYEPPAGGGHYYKLKGGENRFRAVTPAIAGKVYWVRDGGSRKPHRRRYSQVEQGDAPEGFEQCKDFIAFAVIDRNDNSIKILELTQTTIIESIYSLANSEDWGDPCDHDTGYDIIVKRTGDGMDTKYSILPAKQQPLSADERSLVADNPVNLEALYDGDDPFSANRAAGTSNSEQSASSSNASTEVTVLQVDVVNHQNGKFWKVQTDDGTTHYTRDSTLSIKAQEAVGKLAEITAKNVSGKSQLLDIRIAEASAVWEGETDDIPF